MAGMGIVHSPLRMALKWATHVWLQAASLLALAKAQKPADRFSVLAGIFCIDAELTLGTRPAAAVGLALSGSPLSGTPDLPRLILPNVRTLFAHRVSASQTYPLQKLAFPNTAKNKTSRRDRHLRLLRGDGLSWRVHLRASVIRPLRRTANQAHQLPRGKKLPSPATFVEPKRSR
jgi:hypothetical protein